MTIKDFELVSGCSKVFFRWISEIGKWSSSIWQRSLNSKSSNLLNRIIKSLFNERAEWTDKQNRIMWQSTNSTVFQNVRATKKNVSKNQIGQTKTEKPSSIPPPSTKRLKRVTLKRRVWRTVRKRAMTVSLGHVPQYDTTRPGELAV